MHVSSHSCRHKPSTRAKPSRLLVVARPRKNTLLRRCHCSAHIRHFLYFSNTEGTHFSMIFSRTCAVATAESPLLTSLKGSTQDRTRADDPTAPGPALDNLHGRYSPARGPQCTASLEPELLRRRVRVAFEFPLHSSCCPKPRSEAKKGSSTPPTRQRNTTETERRTPANTTTVPVHIDPANPICKFLRPDSLPATQSTGSKKKNHTRPSDPASIATPPAVRRDATTSRLVPDRMCSVWNLRSVAPLIRWLHGNGVRYTVSDWEVHMTNGERARTVTQHGEMVCDTQTFHEKSYVCYDAFRQGVWLRVKTEEVLDAQTHPPSAAVLNWWSMCRKSLDQTTTTSAATEKTGKREQGKADCSSLKVPSQPATFTSRDASYMNGIYHNIRQHRVYRWSPSVHLHLYTTDAKHFRVVVEHVLGPPPDAPVSKTDAANDKDCFYKLVNNLAYHFSQHVSRQRGGRGLKQK